MSNLDYQKWEIIEKKKNIHERSSNQVGHNPDSAEKLMECLSLEE